MRLFAKSAIFVTLATPLSAVTIEDVKDFCQGSTEVLASSSRGQIVYSSEKGLEANGEALELRERGVPIERLNFEPGQYLECVVVLTEKFKLVE